MHVNMKSAYINLFMREISWVSGLVRSLEALLCSLLGGETVMQFVLAVFATLVFLSLLLFCCKLKTCSGLSGDF